MPDKSKGICPESARPDLDTSTWGVDPKRINLAVKRTDTTKFYRCTSTLLKYQPGHCRSHRAREKLSMVTQPPTRGLTRLVRWQTRYEAKWFVRTSALAVSTIVGRGQTCLSFYSDDRARENHDDDCDGICRACLGGLGPELVCDVDSTAHVTLSSNSETTGERETSMGCEPAATPV